jgi:hypothetical protein
MNSINADGLILTPIQKIRLQENDFTMNKSFLEQIENLIGRTKLIILTGLAQRSGILKGSTI